MMLTAHSKPSGRLEKITIILIGKRLLVPSFSFGKEPNGVPLGPSNVSEA